MKSMFHEHCDTKDSVKWLKRRKAEEDEMSEKNVKLHSF